MSLEIILDILLSAVVLYVYHSDCKSFSPSPMRSFAPVLAVAAIDYEVSRGYDRSYIPMEWLLEADADEAYESFLADVGKLIDGNTGKPYTAVVMPLYTLEQLQGTSVKALRSLAKAIGVKGTSRKSKAELTSLLADHYGTIG